MEGQVVQGQQDEGLKETISVWEPAEVLASTEVSASKAEVTSIEARDVAESPTVGEEFGSSLMLDNSGVNASKGEIASIK